MPNRLAEATSPYLLQHKDNPVDWWPWGDGAFESARRRDVPVLLSVGYAACHWCHVMAHESFEDAEVAGLMNELFVCVKVDREERPDVDGVYMAATQAMTGQGGWPMTAFLTPDGAPFYCGTYYPPAPHSGLPAFRQVLLAVSEAWRERRAEVLDSGHRVVAALSGTPVPERTPLVPAPVAERPPALGPGRLDRAVAGLAAGYDETYGGFGRAPKFPPSMCLEFLLRAHARTGDADALRMVEHTCERMARGGIHDQLAGGFARYSVDRGWVVPHFEKMLYDNAQLLRVYLHLWRQTGSPLALRVVTGTAGFLLRDLRTDQGGFASALDADTDGREGTTYVWDGAGLAEVLGPADGRWAADLLAVSPTGTFEDGMSVLQLPADPSDPDRWKRVLARLLEARDRRPQPARDDKVVSAWNGLAIAALAEAGVILSEQSYLDAAVACAELLLDVHLVDGRLRRVSRNGRVGAPAGVAEDYGDVAEGLLVLHQATGAGRWLVAAGELLDTALAHFADPNGGFYDTADDAESLISRPADPTDNAAPSGNSALAGALLGYAALTGSQRHRAAAESALRVVEELAVAQPRFCGWALAVAEAAGAGPLQVAVAGSGPDADALLRVAWRATSPGTVVVGGWPGAEGVPLLAGRPLVDGAAAAYVCRGFVCDRPVLRPDALAEALRARLG
ncbi:MAG TPA: thioredoxin domain-containing protein [Mycobacteriales bacterium]|nr:thioredoxin domain-containing protein [Mycobacteriales bacterium]